MTSYSGEIKVFLSSISAKKRHALKHIGKSGIAHGLRCKFVEESAYSKCDLAVMWGLPKDVDQLGHDLSGAQHLRNDVFEKHRGPVVVVEAPLVGRRVAPRRRRPWLMKKVFPTRSKLTRLVLHKKLYMDEVYNEYRIGVNGGFSDDGGLALAPFCPPRWTKLAKRLDLLAPAPYRTVGRHVVVVGQVPGDASLRGVDINEWMLTTCETLVKLTDRPIVLRPHPLARLEPEDRFFRKLTDLGVGVDDVGRPFGTTIRGAWAVVTYSSGAAIDSLLAGIPAVAMSPASYAWEVTDHDLGSVVEPSIYDRTRWLEKIAAAQWSELELERGGLWRAVLMAATGEN